MTALHSRMRGPAGALLARFRRQRPLRGGSLIVTVFGDAIAPRGGAIALASLIQVMAPFGLTERLVRTSVARLAADDWLSSRRDGRYSEYRLSPRGEQRFIEATLRIYGGPAISWNGCWTFVVAPGLAAARRLRLRKLLRWKGFGEIDSGVLAHPMASPDSTREYLAMNDLADAAILLESRAAPGGDSVRLVRHGWDLRDLAARYERLIRQLESVGEALTRQSTPEPAAAFIVRTLLIHEYRKIHLRDPLLPHALLPTDWPGTAAYELCRRLYWGVFSPAEAYLSAIAGRLDGALPAADGGVRRRFPPQRSAASMSPASSSGLSAGA